MLPDVSESIDNSEPAAAPRYPYDIADVQITSGARFECKPPWFELTTLLTAWTYAAIIPVKSGGAVRHRYRITVAVEVEVGKISVGILMRSGALFYEEAIIKEGQGRKDVTLFTPQIEDCGAFVIRNAAADQTSRLRWQILDMAPAEGEPCLPVPIAGERLFRALDALTELLARGDAEAKRAYQFRSNLLARNRRLLEHFDALIYDPQEDVIADELMRMPRPLLVEMAAAFGRLVPLGFSPNWVFNSGLESGDFTVRLRAILWKAIVALGFDDEVRVPWYGDTKLALHFGNDLSLAIYVGGTFEPNQLTILSQVLRPGMTFVDVGANEGVYSIFAASIVGPRGHVVAIEPSPREISRLRRNIRLNDFRNVAVMEAAASHSNGWSELLVAETPHAGLNALARYIGSSTAAIDHRMVRTITLDWLLRTLPNHKIDVIKVDVEGAELDVLLGGISVFQQRPVLLMEVGRDGEPVGEAIFELLTRRSYSIFSIDDNLGNIVPVAEVDSAAIANIVAFPDNV